MTREEALQEVHTLIDAYRKKFPMGRKSFFTRSSLLGNTQGDSARYWELQKILGNDKTIHNNFSYNSVSPQQDKPLVPSGTFVYKTVEQELTKEDRLKKYMMEHKQFSFENPNKKYMNIAPYFVGPKETHLWGVLKRKGVDWFKTNHKEIYNKWKKYIKK